MPSVAAGAAAKPVGSCQAADQPERDGRPAVPSQEPAGMPADQLGRATWLAAAAEQRAMVQAVQMVGVVGRAALAKTLEVWLRGRC